MVFRRNDFPSIDPVVLNTWMNDGQALSILDVREAQELRMARLADERVVHLPISRLAHEGLPPELKDPHQRLVVMCHMGARSAQVTAWLCAQGWDQTYNLSGGIDAYARVVNPAVGVY